MDVSSVLSDDLSDYDVISNPSQRSIESSIADLQPPLKPLPDEPAPTQAARERLHTVGLSAEDIQAYVRRALEGSRIMSSNGSGSSHRFPTEHRTVRVYVDGSFDMFNAGHALQLRQAKLSFPSVHLIVGVFTDDPLSLLDSPITTPLVERCEVVRHCRWVDEIIPGAPGVLEDQYIVYHRIDYVALEEGFSVDPDCDLARVKGYDVLKKLGKVIPVRKTHGLTNIPPFKLSTPRTQTHETPFLHTPPVQEHMDTFGIGI